jgi:hypothetical protein
MTIRSRLAPLVGMLALAAVAFNAAPARADLILTLERLNDNTAVLSGSGTTIDLSSSIYLEGASATLGDSGIDGISGDLAIGSHDAYETYIVAGTQGLAVNFLGGLWALGDMPSGASTITLDVETWAAVGTTGNVYTRSSTSYFLGTYSIIGPRTTVPEPASIALMGIGLAGLIAVRRRRR